MRGWDRSCRLPGAGSTCCHRARIAAGASADARHAAIVDGFRRDLSPTAGRGARSHAARAICSGDDDRRAQPLLRTGGEECGRAIRAPVASAGVLPLGVTSGTYDQTFEPRADVVYAGVRPRRTGSRRISCGPSYASLVSMLTAHLCRHPARTSSGCRRLCGRCGWNPTVEPLWMTLPARARTKTQGRRTSTPARPRHSWCRPCRSPRRTHKARGRCRDDRAGAKAQLKSTRPRASRRA